MLSQSIKHGFLCKCTDTSIITKDTLKSFSFSIPTARYHHTPVYDIYPPPQLWGVGKSKKTIYGWPSLSRIPQKRG